MILHRLGISFQETESVFLDFGCGNVRNSVVLFEILVPRKVVFLLFLWNRSHFRAPVAPL